MARQDRSGDNQGREVVQQVAGRIQRHRPQNIEILRDGPIARTASGSHPATCLRAKLAVSTKVSVIMAYGDTERFARMAALMAMLGHEINGYGSANHSELERQVDKK